MRGLPSVPSVADSWGCCVVTAGAVLIVSTGAVVTGLATITHVLAIAAFLLAAEFAAGEGARAWVRAASTGIAALAGRSVLLVLVPVGL